MQLMEQVILVWWLNSLDIIWYLTSRFYLDIKYLVFLNDGNDLVCGLLFYENKWYAVELKAIFKYLNKSGPTHFIALFTAF